MTKILDTSVASHAPTLAKERAVQGGWRIKKRKTNDGSKSGRRITRLSSSKIPFRAETYAARLSSVIPSKGGLRKSRSKPVTERRYWSRPLGVLGLVAAAIALIVTAGEPSSWLDMSGVSPPAIAETSAPSQLADLSAVDEGYLLHLGSYPSELGAQLMWAGLEANRLTMLNRLDPVFTSHEGDQGTVYDVLAGRFVSREDAKGHCAWLNDNEVACSVVDG